MRRGTKVTVAAVAVLAVVGGGVALSTVQASGRSEARTDRTGLPPATAAVERGDLSESTQVEGVLGHAGSHKVNAGAAGTLTWSPSVGSTVKRDGRLYEVNGKPVRLMYGSGPMYRSLKPGDKGPDVKQLEQNLQALGFAASLAVDEKYTAGTADAVRRWQESHDLEETGTVGPDRIAFAPGALRVKDKPAAAGDQVGPGRQVLTATGSERVVSFSLEVSESTLAKEGTKVTVDLPDGSTAPGRISSVGKIATAGDDPTDKTPKVSLTVAFDAPDKVRAVDQAPVTVNLTGETRTGVLTVPVNALLAHPKGGFGVQVVSGGAVRDVRVELGMFGQGGRVEVGGGALREGMKVGVPKI
ncbi:peptidoglycan-binding protein [Streptomyces sp. NPDC054863]